MPEDTLSHGVTQIVIERAPWEFSPLHWRDQTIDRQFLQRLLYQKLAPVWQENDENATTVESKTSVSGWISPAKF